MVAYHLSYSFGARVLGHDHWSRFTYRLWACWNRSNACDLDCCRIDQLECVVAGVLIAMSALRQTILSFCLK